jgi:hypothetical protein
MANEVEPASNVAEAAARCWTRLEWDSAFFGLEIGSVDMGAVDEEILAEVERQAAADGIACLYGRHDSGALDVAAIAQRQGFRFVEAAMLFDVNPVIPPPPCPEGVVVRLGVPADRDAVLPVVDRMADWSRYAADPRFGTEQSIRMQRAWLDRSIDDPTGNRAIFVAEDEAAGEIVAFMGVLSEPARRIDAVGTTRRGSGAARFLVEQCRQWAEGEKLYGGPIAARNVLAQRFVAQSGLRVDSVEYLYHRWLDEER